MSRFVENVNKTEHQKVAAWFLGPKAENEKEFLELITIALHDHATWRRQYFPTDPPYIEDDIKNSVEFRNQMAKIKEELDILNLRLRNSIPSFNSRYKGHMNWEVSMVGMLGYFAAMLYNQNNVAAEASAVTTVIESEVGEDLCKMLRFTSHFPTRVSSSAYSSSPSSLLPSSSLSPSSGLLPSSSSPSAPTSSQIKAVFKKASPATTSTYRAALKGKAKKELVKEHFEKRKNVPKRPRGALPRATTPDPIAWGHITSCGSVANFEGAWAARNVKYLAYTIRQAINVNPAHDDLYVVLADGTTKFIADFDLTKEVDVWALLNVPANNALDLLHRYGDDLDGLDFALKAVRDFSIQTVGVAAMPGEKAKYFVPATAHYSWPKAGALLGIGEDQMIPIAVDDFGRLNVDELEQKILEVTTTTGDKKRAPVLFVVAIMGSTTEGAMDPIKKVADLRDRLRTEKGVDFNIHADAAWGGYCASLITDQPGLAAANAATATTRARSFPSSSSFAPSTYLSDHVNENLKNIHRADTITLDPHKAGYIQYPAGSICFQNKRMRDMLAYKAPYITPLEGISEDPTVGTYGIDGSRPGAAAVATYLHHRVTKLTPEGHGLLIGQANFNTKMMWALLATMAGPQDPFRLSQIHEPDTPELKALLKKAITLSNDELPYHEDVVEALRNNGPDFLINNFALNYSYPVLVYDQETRTPNTSITQAMKFMEAVGAQLNTPYAQYDPDTLRPKGVGRKGLFVIRNIVFTETYTPAILKLTKAIGLDYDVTTEDDFSMLVSTNMEPWSTAKGFLEIFERELRQAILRGVGIMTEVKENAHHSFIAVEASGSELFAEQVASFRTPEYSYHSVLTITVGLYDEASNTYYRSENTKYDFLAAYKDSLAQYPGKPFVITVTQPETIYNLIYREEGNEWVEAQFWVGLDRVKLIGTAYIHISDVIANNHFDPAAEYPINERYLMKVFGTPDNVYASHVITKRPGYQELLKLKTNLPGVSSLMLELGFEVTLLGVSAKNTPTVSPLQIGYGYPIELVRENNEIYASSLQVESQVWFSTALNDAIAPIARKK